MDDDPNKSKGLSLLTKLRVELLMIVPKDTRRKASRLVNWGDQMRKDGNGEGARYLYDKALKLADSTGMHYLRKKLFDRLDLN